MKCERQRRTPCHGSSLRYGKPNAGTAFDVPYRNGRTGGRTVGRPADRRHCEVTATTDPTTAHSFIEMQRDQQSIMQRDDEDGLLVSLATEIQENGAR